MAWMTIEAVVAIVSGILASSIALIGFGLDSVITFFAATVVVWQLRGTVSEERLHIRRRADRHRAQRLSCGSCPWTSSDNVSTTQPGGRVKLHGRHPKADLRYRRISRAAVTAGSTTLRVQRQTRTSSASATRAL
jgi:hypothetical protein